MPGVTVSDLSKTYGKTTALVDLNLDIADGEFFVILGPSGAGKTTTLKSVAGLQEIDKGTVTIGGVDMTGVEPYRRNVAMAFESYALYPQSTVFENLASPLRSGRTGRYSAAQQQERIDAVTTTLGIDKLQQRLPKELSNGQRQRVALGRVLVRPADVYLLDEPLSHLDAKLRASMRAELKRLGQMSNTTTMYVTHDYQEALSLGDRIGVLRSGRMVQIGTRREVWLEPADTFVARALGQPEMNIMDGEVSDGQVIALGGALSVTLPPGIDVGADRRIRIGMRPGDLQAAAAAGTPATTAPDGGPDGGAVTMAGTVDLAERLGRQVELSVRIGEINVIVLTSGREGLASGDAVRVSIPAGQVHLFAGTTDPEQDTPRLGSLGGRRAADAPDAVSGGDAVSGSGAVPGIHAGPEPMLRKENRP